MSAGRVCTRVIATASPDESIGAAARRMEEYDVGSLVVVGGDRYSRPIGIVTDRDIVVRGVAKKLDTEETRVSDVMTAPVQAVGEHMPIEEAISRMAVAGTRRVVVTGDGDRVLGILSLDDVLDLLVEETRAIGRLLEKQKPRIPA
jgi:CBS domain-containing protein